MSEGLDIRTLMVCAGAVNITLAALMVTLSLTRRTYPGFHLWTLGFVAGGVGSALLALRGVVPDFLSMVVGNYGIVGFSLFLGRGLAVFLRRPQRPVFEAFWLIVLGIGLVWSSFVEVSARDRALVVMTVFLVFTLRVIVVAYRGGARNGDRPDWLLVAVLVLGFCSASARIVLTIVSPPSASFLEQGPALGITLLLFTLVSIGSMSAAVSLNSRRLEHELSQSELGLQREQATLERLNRELSELAVRDGLTGLHNRRHFDEVLEREWHRLARARRPLSLALMDIDHFKEFNDLYGHQQGDEALQTVAQVVEAAVKRTSDVAVRYGGEEFALVLPETDAHGARQIAERIVSVLRERGIPHEGSQAGPALSLSIGLATLVPGAGTVPDTLVALADEALYRSKKEGRNRLSEAVAPDPAAAR